MKQAQVRSWRWIWSLFGAYRLAIAGLCVGTVAQSLLQIALAVLTRYVMDAGLAGDGRFLPLGGALLAVLLAMVVLRSVLRWSAGRLADQSAAELRYVLLDTAEHSDGERLRQFSSGVILNRGLEDVKVLCEAMTGLIPTLFGNLARLVGAFSILAVFYLPLAGILAGACVVVGAGAVCLRPVLRRCHRQVRETEEQAFSTMQEYAQQLELLQALGAEKESLRRYWARLEQSLNAKRKRRNWSLGAGTALSLLTQIGTGCLLLWGIHAIYEGALSYGALTSILQLLVLFRSPVVSLSGFWGRMTAVEVAGERLRELLDTDGAAPAQKPRALKPLRVRAVVFDHVTFRYKASEPPVLEDYSARFDLTGWTCLSGVSGRGKTTLFKLILGIYQPQSGRVYLETDCGERLCGKDTRHLFAYVPQDFALFSESILENLLLVSPEADRQSCVQALETAQAGFVQELGEGLGTQVREQRTGLSMGQLQRIAIARAVLMDRPVLLLDECTSALDSRTELAVLQALRSLGGGAVFVTHHPEVLSGMEPIQTIRMEEST